MTTRLVTGRKGGHLANAHWFLQALNASTGEERPGFPVEITGDALQHAGNPVQRSLPGAAPRAAPAGRRRVRRLRLRLRHHPLPRHRRRLQRRHRRNHDDVERRERPGDRRKLAGRGLAERRRARLRHPGTDHPRDRQRRLADARTLERTPADAVRVGPRADRRRPTGRSPPRSSSRPTTPPRSTRTTRTSARAARSRCPTEYFGTAGIPHLVIQDGKDGRVFLLNADDMGGYLQGPEESDAVLQQLGPFDGVWGHPAAYGGAGRMGLRARERRRREPRARTATALGPHGEPQLVPEGQSTESFGYASGSPTVTSNGTTAGSAVVWVIYEGDERQAARSCAPTARSPKAARSRCCGRARSAPHRSSRSRPPPKVASTSAPAAAISTPSALLPGPAAGGAGRIRDGRSGARPDRPAVARGSPGPASDGADRHHRRGTAGGQGGLQPRDRASRPHGRTQEDPRQRVPAQRGRAGHQAASARRPAHRRAEPGGERVLQAGTPGADRGAAAGAHERRHEDGPGHRLRQRPRPDPLRSPARLRGAGDARRRQVPELHREQLVDASGADHRRAPARGALRGQRSARRRGGARSRARP